MTSKHLRGPFTADFIGGYVWAADGFMFAQIRGWGQIKYGPNPEATQDEHLQFLVDALNEKWERQEAEARRQVLEAAAAAVRVRQEACAHKNKDVYKDYHSKIITCKDCGLQW